MTSTTMNISYDSHPVYPQLVTCTDPSALPYGLQRNLVIGCATNADLKTLHRFVRSVRLCCNTASIVLILNDALIADDDYQQLANIYRVDYISFEKHLPHEEELAKKHIILLRWIMLYRYLDELKHKPPYDNVFITDTRDVLFQSNIFACMASYGSGLYMFLEPSHTTLGECQYNRAWLIESYGDDILAQISSLSISCAGTVLGSWPAILVYLRAMSDELINNPKCNDQAAHNYLLYATPEKLDTVIHKIDHEKGFLATLHHRIALKRNKFGLLLNNQDNVYAVLHQFDRSRQLWDRLDRDYKLLTEDELIVTEEDDHC